MKKVPLRYQISEYDCVPTTFLNALSYIFDRKEIPPEVIKMIMLYSLDSFDKNGEAGKGGTTGIAIRHLCEWLNYYSEQKAFNISCELLEEKSVDLIKNDKIKECINNDGVVLVRVNLGRDHHYALIVEIDEENVYLFDPYFRKRKFKNENIEIIDNNSFKNRKVNLRWFNSNKSEEYTLDIFEERYCILMSRM